MNTQKLNLHIRNIAELYKAYMPFIKKGGLFIATNESFVLHQEVTISLQLLQEIEIFNLSGKIIWLTPEKAQNGRKAGIGIQFDASSSNSVVQKIESYLKEYSSENMLTDTL